MMESLIFCLVVALLLFGLAAISSIMEQFKDRISLDTNEYIRETEYRNPNPEDEEIRFGINSLINQTLERRFK